MLPRADRRRRRRRRRRLAGTATSPARRCARCARRGSLRRVASRSRGSELAHGRAASRWIASPPAPRCASTARAPRRRRRARASRRARRRAPRGTRARERARPSSPAAADRPQPAAGRALARRRSRAAARARSGCRAYDHVSLSTVFTLVQVGAQLDRFSLLRAHLEREAPSVRDAGSSPRAGRAMLGATSAPPTVTTPRARPDRRNAGELLADEVDHEALRRLRSCRCRGAVARTRPPGGRVGVLAVPEHACTRTSSGSPGWIFRSGTQYATTLSLRSSCWSGSRPARRCPCPSRPSGSTQRARPRAPAASRGPGSCAKSRSRWSEPEADAGPRSRSDAHRERLRLSSGRHEPLAAVEREQQAVGVVHLGPEVVERRAPCSRRGRTCWSAARCRASRSPCAGRACESTLVVVCSPGVTTNL